MNKYVCQTALTLLLGVVSTASMAQRRVEPVAYGNMDQWLVRQVEESLIIGGNTKLLYEVAPTDTIISNDAYKNLGGSPWATSNVLAKVGVTKTNTSVFSEPRGDGYCARLETRIETCVVLGIVNIKVLAAGSMYLGTVHEPIRDTKNPQSKLGTGIPFTKKPAGVMFDYKVKLTGEADRIKRTGFGRASIVKGQDCPEVNVLLQKRWEDAEGNLFAKRIGTAVVRYTEGTNDWVNAAEYPILYGDITNNAAFKPYMGLIKGESTRFSLNSKGESVPVTEVGWGNATDTPTHLILQFTSSHGGAYIGSPGNTLWVDNVGLIYE